MDFVPMPTKCRRLMPLLFAALLCCCVGDGHAQSPPPFVPERMLGVTGGINYSSVGFVPQVNQQLLRGFQAGVVARWRTERYLGLQAELNYKQQGWSEAFEGINTEGLYYRRRMNYVELPFMTHIYFGSERVQFFFNIGPQIGWLLNEQTAQNLNGQRPQITNEQHSLPTDRRLEWGLLGGGGVELRTGIGSFLVEGRYFYSLSDFYHTRKKDVFSQAAGRSISARVTYLIPY